MAAVGDSITAADSFDIAGGNPGPESWVTYALGPNIEFIGGWAVWGATTGEMLEGITGPFDADVLVIHAGTNDAGRVPFVETAAHIEAIVERAGIDTVVLSGVPPHHKRSADVIALNEHLQPFAEQHGWFWVDASAGLRDGDRFARGMTYDGTHPTKDGARIIGEAIGAAVLEAASE